MDQSTGEEVIVFLSPVNPPKAIAELSRLAKNLPRVLPAGAQSSDKSLNIGTKSAALNTENCPNVATNPRNCNNINDSKTGICLDVGTDSAKEGNGKEPEEVELKQKFKLEFIVDPKFMKKLDNIKSRLSRKYPEGVSSKQKKDSENRQGLNIQKIDISSELNDLTLIYEMQI